MNSPSSTTADPPLVGELVCIALGSNLASGFGTPVETVRAAMDRLAEWTAQPLLRSSLWISEPLDCPPGSPPFINAVVGLQPVPGETAEGLLLRLRNLEQEFGRRHRDQVNAARCLDLDLICFGDQRRQSPTLVLPHPEAQRRNFVLLPLAEIAPQLCLPGLASTVQELAASLTPDGPFIAKIHS